MTVSKKYPAVEKSLIDSLVDSLSFEFERVGETTTTVCYAYLPNGFRVGHGDSACVDPRNFDFDEGCKWAKERAIADAKQTLWQVEGYLLNVTGHTSDTILNVMTKERDIAPSASDVGPSWQTYKGRQINRTAYEIKPDDKIVSKSLTYTGGPSQSSIEIDGEEFDFVHYEPAKPGDFICYLDESDIYHVRRSVMQQRNYL
ncbi:hypothetical protein ETS23_20970 [Vibrio parahaemolyticus]|nr:hypothetical protein [Vibrio parahaemolyticus]